MSNEVDKLLSELRELSSNEIKLEEVPKIKIVENLFDITTYNEVCKQLGESEESCPYKQIKQIEKLFNNGWKKDFSTNQENWYPYFQYEKNSGGLVFYFSFCISYFSSGPVSFYKDEKTASFVGRTFIDIYNKL